MEAITKASEQGKMTIHRALSELKVLDSRINKHINEIFPIGFHQKDKLVDNRFTMKEFNEMAPAAYQSVIDLIERKNKIKCAIVESNASTIVTVAGKTMKVAEAINYKSTISYKKNFANTLRQKYLALMGVFNKNKENVDKNVQILLEAALGKDSVKKADTNQIEAIQKPYLETNEFHLCDPLKLDEKIKDLEKEIGDFEADVDAALSTSNANTFIEL